MMHRHGRSAGYTLVELLTVIAVLGVIAAIALPIHGAQMDSARMVKTRKHFDDATRIARQELIRDHQSRGLGQPSSLPADERAWILRFDADGSALAPGGGAAFLADSAGDPRTGAIGVTWNAAERVLILARPAQAGVDAESTTISADSSATIRTQASIPVTP